MPSHAEKNESGPGGEAELSPRMCHRAHFGHSLTIDESEIESALLQYSDVESPVSQSTQLVDVARVVG